jgi:hypothetical protein
MTPLNGEYLEQRRAEGANVVVQWVYSGGTLDLHTDYAHFAVDRSIELLEATPGNVADKTYLAGLKNATARLTCFATASGGTVLEAALVEGTFGTLIYGPSGSANGMPKRGFAAYVRRFGQTLNADGLTLIEVEFQKSGALVYGPGSVW